MQKAFQHILLLLKEHTRLDWLHTLTVLGLLSGILLTLPQWSAIRSYPLVPVIPHFSLPNEVHLVLLLLLVTSFSGALLSKRFRTLGTSIGVLSLVVLSLLDITRFQPWIFHYLAILLLFSYCIRSTFTNNQLLDAARIVVGGIYFWSGVQKINAYFMMAIFPWFTSPVWEIAPTILLSFFFSLGILVPFLEAAFGLGLFTKKFRTLSIISSTAMILLVLYSLGPLGHNWNSSVWPWNIAIFLTVIALFYNTSFSFKGFIARSRKSTIAIVMFGLFWIMPLGNAFGLVDGYLSWSLYSGRVPEAVLHGDQLLLQKLSPDASQNRLLFSDWTMSEMNQIPYPSETVFTSVFRQTCAEFDNDSSLYLDITSPDYFQTRHRPVTRQYCKDL